MIALFSRNGIKGFILLVSFLVLFNTNTQAQYCEGSINGVYQANANYLGMYGNWDCTVSLIFGTSLGVTPACHAEDPYAEACANSNLSCFYHCYQYRLFLDDVEVAEVCTDYDVYTFHGIPWTSGNYKVVIVYKDYGYCSNLGGYVCLTFVETRTVNLASGAANCTNITNIHNNGYDAYVHKEDNINLNCVLQNNKRSDVISQTSVNLQPGFNSGAGGNTMFHAFIAPCPPHKMGQTGHLNQTARVRKPEESDSFVNGNLVQVNAQIFPNPNEGEFNIEITDHDFNQNPIQISIYDVTGRVVYSMNTMSEVNNLDLSHLNTGVYVVHLRSQTFEKSMMLKRL